VGEQAGALSSSMPRSIKSATMASMGSGRRRRISQRETMVGRSCSGLSAVSKKDGVGGRFLQRFEQGIGCTVICFLKTQKYHHTILD
jgi:hypothetical protein